MSSNNNMNKRKFTKNFIQDNFGKSNDVEGHNNDINNILAGTYDANTYDKLSESRQYKNTIDY